MGTGPSSSLNNVDDDDMLDADSHGIGELKHIPIEIKPRGMQSPLVFLSRLAKCAIFLAMMLSKAILLGKPDIFLLFSFIVGRLGQLGLRSVGSLGKKSKGGSLQSALSLDLENPEAERIRRDFDMFRKNKDNELANLQKKEQKLEAENKRLRAELKALQVDLCAVRQAFISVLPLDTGFTLTIVGPYSLTRPFSASCFCF